VQCTADASCSGTTPHCQTMAGIDRCVQCLQDSQCPAATPHCIADICH
jgi:hypothetical protein